MISKLRFTKGHNSVKYEGGVTVLVLCTSADDSLYLYQVFLKISPKGLIVIVWKLNYGSQMARQTDKGVRGEGLL